MLDDSQIASFRESGFLLVRNFLPQDRVASLRQAIRSHFQEGQGKAVGSGHVEADLGVTFPEIAWMIDYPPALEIARQLVGPEVMHPHESGAHMGRVQRGWHKDARDSQIYDPEGSDWSDDYRVVHFAYYLQDHVENSGGLSVRRGSHRIRNTRDGEPLTIESRAGDLVIFDLRTTHSGNALQLRSRAIPRSFAFPPQFEPLLRRLTRPSYLGHQVITRFPGLFHPEHRDRMAIFVVYGADDAHTRNFFEYLKARPDYPHLSRYDGPVRVG